MDNETIVAVFDTAAHAESAVSALKAAGVSESAISLHGGTSTGATTTTATAPREEGFWSNLFGGSADHDAAVYDRSLEGGSTVVTVKAPEAHTATVMEILESHHPIDIDERATGYGFAQTSMAGQSAPSSTYAGTTGATMAGATTGVTGSGMGTLATGANDSVQLAEESLAVGKRLVNRGGTRIRRYVVETPVEESVSLHDEKVTLERRPVTDGRPVTDASFSEKTIEMTETAEEAVVSKTARVYEEVGLSKTATDRTETVHDTVRKEEVEIEQLPGTATTTGGTMMPRGTDKI